MGHDTDSHWLNRERFFTYTRVFFLVYLILAIGVLAHSNLVKADGFPIWFDFAVFWSASKVTLLGHAADAYNLDRLHAVLHTLHPEINEGSYGWFYPPSYLLLISQLARVSFFQAYLIFMSLSLAAYVLVVRRICTTPQALWALAGFPGVWDNFLTGQNGFLTAAIAGGALLLLDKRPILAGLLAGLLSIKPQLAVLFPVAFIASGSWKALLAAACSSVLSILAASAILGVDTLIAWLHSLDLARAFLEIGGTNFWMRMPTVFASTHLLGAPRILAYGLHLTVACGVLATVWTIWRRCKEPMLRNAALVTGTLLMSPYVLIYDLTWLALPIAWFGRYAMEQGWRRGEREVLIAAWFLPAVMLILARCVTVQIGPWVTLLLLYAIWRRATHGDSPR
ncbi:MAG: DUF2029 domain-containing protein [Betaproteobacteria bacterium]|nr:DUF2029 domain-containing protein [Betaproteobacteria bacterium]